jgi:oxalate decarboxylase/phosphoglucose isomerase-like protein (cupin superfamily)
MKMKRHHTVEIERATNAKHFRTLVEAEPKRPVVYSMTVQEKERFVAHGKWNPQFFAERKGQIQYRESKKPTFFNIAQDSIWELAHFFLLRTCSWPEFIDKIIAKNSKQKGSGKVILSGVDAHLRELGGEHAEQWKDCWDDVKTGLDDFVPVGSDSADLGIVGVWMSGSGISCQTHWDIIGDHNMNFQIKGKKRFLLWEPMDGHEHLYPVPYRFWNTSRIPDPDNVDLEQFPLYRHAIPFEVEMTEGDILFIPARWWHQASHYGDFNVNITAWYKSQYRLRKPHPLKTFGVPHAFSGLFVLLKVLCAVILVLIMMLKRKIMGLVGLQTDT